MMSIPLEAGQHELSPVELIGDSTMETADESLTTKHEDHDKNAAEYMITGKFGIANILGAIFLGGLGVYGLTSNSILMGAFGVLVLLIVGIFFPIHIVSVLRVSSIKPVVTVRDDSITFPSSLFKKDAPLITIELKNLSLKFYPQGEQVCLADHRRGQSDDRAVSDELEANGLAKEYDFSTLGKPALEDAIEDAKNRMFNRDDCRGTIMVSMNGKEFKYSVSEFKDMREKEDSQSTT